MNEDFSHVGSVRRRPRSGQQRSQGSNHWKANGKSNGAANGNGSYGPHKAGPEKNSTGPDDRQREFEREAYYDQPRDRGSQRGFAKEERFERKQKKEQRPAQN